MPTYTQPGQYGPEALIDSAGNALVGATATVPAGYTAVIDSLGNLTVQGPPAQAVLVQLKNAANVTLPSKTVVVSPDVADIPSASDVAGTYLPKWKANTAYAGGDFVLNPVGLVVQRISSGSSGSTYDSSMWTVINAGASSSGTAAKNLKTDFGAKGDGRFLADAVTTSSSTTVTSATAAFAVGDVGRTVAVYSATGAQIAFGTIASRTSATAVVLSAPATASGTSLRAVVGTDDTAALQSAYNDMATSGGGSTYVPPGVYVIAGPQQTSTSGGQTYSGQVLIPSRDLAQGIASLHLFGDTPVGGVGLPLSVPQEPPPMRTGFFSTAMSGAMISGRGSTANDQFGADFGTTVRWSEQYLVIRNLQFRTSIDPGVTMIKADTMACAEINECSFDVLANSSVIATTPWNRGGHALTLPSHFNQTKAGAHRICIAGYATGLQHSEHTSLDEVSIQLCAVGIAFQHSPSGYHAPVYGRVLVQSCQVSLQNRSTSGNACAFVGNLIVEMGGAGNQPAALVYIDDPNSFFQGELNISPTNFGTYQSTFGSNAMVVKGAVNMRLKNLRTGSYTTVQNNVATPTGQSVGPAPETPTIGTATAGVESASVAFTPAGTGQSASTYTATASPGGKTGTANSSPITVNGLTGGTAYTFTVKANFQGASSGNSASSNTITPTAAPAFATDNFNRADSTTTMNPASDGGTWTPRYGVWGINGNAAYFVGVGAVGSNNGGIPQSVTRPYPTTGTVTVSAVLSAAGSQNIPCLVTRVTITQNTTSPSLIFAAENGIYVYNVTGDGSVFGSQYNNIGSNVGTQTAWAAGDLISLTDDGNSLTLKRNGVTIKTASTTFLNSSREGGIGVAQSNTAVRWDNFTITTP